MANTSLCNNIRLFIGPLIDSKVTLNNVNGNQVLSLNTGTIRIAWEDDSGETLAYEFQDVVYNPSSPFKILSIGRVGHHFGSIYSLLTKMKKAFV